MLVQQRQAIIVDEVRRSGARRVSDLVEMLGVSDMTIRRDLDTLARRGLLEKVHGGATVPADPSTTEPRFAEKSLRERSEKEAIAREAARLVRPGAAIGLSAGSTTWVLARLLRGVPDLTVVTNSVRVSDVFSEGGHPGQTVVLTGGIRTPSDALVGPLAVEALRTLHLDTVFMGVYGMETGSGFTTPNMMEAEADRALVASARRLAVLADHTKWRLVGISTFARLDDAHVLVTDAELSGHAREALDDHVGELIVAQPGESVGLDEATNGRSEHSPTEDRARASMPEAR